MSGGGVCYCSEKTKPIAERRWRVIQRNVNHSAFNGGRPEYSDYSEIRCFGCRALWRTKAAYVKQLEDAPAEWWNLP